MAGSSAEQPAGGQRTRSLFDAESGPVAQQTGNAGLFVGVNRFTEDSTVSPLSFAVDDAVAIAHRFVLELKLLQADHTVLALSGEPTANGKKEQLAELQSAGVTLSSATKPRILLQLKRVAGLAQAEEDLLLLSLSSHGFEDEGVPYLMPADGVRAFLDDTAIRLPSMEATLAKSPAGKRLLLLDACRENPLPGGKGGSAAMTSAFREALATAAGQAVLASCDVGQVSFEDPQLQQGVFTHYLLQALDGAAESDRRGIIRLDSVARYVAREVEKWTRRECASVQQPWFKGPETARSLPLAVDIRADEEIKRLLAKLRTLGIDGKVPIEQVHEAERLLTDGPGNETDEKRLEVYVDLAAGKLHPKYLTVVLAGVAPRHGRESPRSAPLSASAAPTSHGSESEKPSDALTLDLGDGVAMDLVRIPAGEFTMGSPESEEGRNDNEGPQHRVQIAQPFYVGKYAVTQAQWRAVMGDSPSHFKGDNRPVEQVSRDNCREFCGRLSARVGREIRLPSEAEWEYACRADTTTAFSFGETIWTDQANYDGNSSYGGGRKGEYRKQTTPVGGFPANAFGLFDMHGNVWEWCEDVWHKDYTGAPSDGNAWVTGGDQAVRVLRGGSWVNDPRHCRSARRDWVTSDLRDLSVGVRVAAGT